MRRRLTVAFVAAAGIAAGALAISSYLLVRDARLSDSQDRAAATLRFDVRQAAQFSQPLDDTEIESLLDAFEQRGDHVVLVAGGQVLPSSEAFAPRLSSSLRRVVAGGEIGYQRSGSRLVVGSRIPASQDELHLVVSEAAIARDLRELRNVLGAGWLVVLLVAGLFGRALAGRTLAPVGRAADAARSIARGSLATRLDVGRDDEFGAWAASFNEMAAALETQIDALAAAQARERRFTADVAHELRTPLTAMVAAGSMLRAHLGAMPVDARRPLELLIADVDRLRRLVDELIEISRLDAGREDVRSEPVDLLALVHAVLDARGWADQVAVAGDAVVAGTDRRRVERIVANLVDNALVHGSGDVRVTVSGDGGNATIEVGDAGTGIAAEHREQLFDRFYKADPARAQAGSGLGLPIPSLCRSQLSSDRVTT